VPSYQRPPRSGSAPSGNGSMVQWTRPGFRAARRA
jgi:hypothetical protein